MDYKAGLIKSERNFQAHLAQSYHDLIALLKAPIPEQIGHYKIGKIIGKGGYSKIVLKCSPKSQAINLSREIYHHSQMDHPHIIKLYEVLYTEEHVWLVQEYCSGGELYDYLVKHTKLSEHETKTLFSQISSAIAYIHMHGSVHRDIKLENIFLTASGNAKVGDLGFIREQVTNKLLQTWSGTLAYSAPEIVNESINTEEKIDVWSLGVLLYALLCGELPFDDDDEGILRLKILNDHPKWKNNLSPEALELLQLMLAKNYKNRPTMIDVLKHPFLEPVGKEYLKYLKVQNLQHFSTDLEKDILFNMNMIGINVDMLKRSVIENKCDALRALWLLIKEKVEESTGNFVNNKSTKRQEKDEFSWVNIVSQDIIKKRSYKKLFNLKDMFVYSKFGSYFYSKSTQNIMENDCRGVPKKSLEHKSNLERGLSILIIFKKWLISLLKYKNSKDEENSDTGMLLNMQKHTCKNANTLTNPRSHILHEVDKANANLIQKPSISSLSLCISNRSEGSEALKDENISYISNFKKKSSLKEGVFKNLDCNTDKYIYSYENDISNPFNERIIHPDSSFISPYKKRTAIKEQYNNKYDTKLENTKRLRKNQEEESRFLQRITEEDEISDK
ncbi:hypothetical protein T552_02581 [Pneumocystis carinii B80]|uniref:Protein kinase domain-containing protein n=1 Tax=Pneumocystis carinii (strain B80) TaxID=1408658 RepID=A0A0W4ZFB8_PNEC8|nr:hypothetical protein T552_02581 [Pneumocystis carinii B80]KTW27089.1 hypothetical protein T552_02581 [Pneumocystis carinii B80]